jgi:EAL and modified HD-GYP domain-containing signal transduction protein
MLGQVETRKWIMAATSAYIAEDKPNEVVKLALTRARFSENLAPLFGLGGQTASVFLVGLFSLIDIILDAPMEQAVREIALDAAIRDSLTGDGPYAKVLEFLLAYEQADWDKVSYMALANDVRAEQVYSAYVESMEWYRDLLEGMANGAKAR